MVLVLFFVSIFVVSGYWVVLEVGVGLKFKFFDYDFLEVGVEIVYSVEEVYKVDVIIKVVLFMFKEVEMMCFN